MSVLFTPQAIPEVILVSPQAFEDNRGSFMEAYKASVYKANGVTADFVQDNLARSSQNVLRGLHYQIHPQPSAKLVQVIQGEVLDVAVDIRKGSPTYGHHVSALLSGQNRQQLYVPEGFAHGYVVRSDTAVLSYKVSSEYAPKVDRGILWSDPALAIAWGVDAPVLSDKDKTRPLLKDAENTFFM